MPTPLWYGQAGSGLVGATAARRFDWANDNIYILLTSTSEVPDQDADDFLSDIDANDVAASATGYTSGTGSQLTNCTVVYDSASNTIRLDGDSFFLDGGSYTAGNAHFYKNTGDRTTSPLIGYIDFGSGTLVDEGTFTINPDATDGYLRMVAD